MLQHSSTVKGQRTEQALDGVITLLNSFVTKAQPLEELDDAQLVRATLKGNRRAYEILVRRYQKLVYNVVYQMIRSHEAASDLTQDTFLKAYKALGTFRTEAKFKPWLLRIATNSCLNMIRDTKDYDSLEMILEENPHAEPPSRQDVEEEVEWKLTQQMLNDALMKLSVRHREVFILRYQHDLSYEDIAETCGETVSTIKSLLFRIREKLRKILADEMSEYDSFGKRKEEEVSVDHG
ncbi:MAG TPA: RNA polymerase sigma factor [Candidatus Obscuribacterales bacterium]